MNLSTIATQAGITLRHFSRIRHTQRRPSFYLAQRLQEITGVRWEAWICPEEYHNPYIKN